MNNLPIEIIRCIIEYSNFIDKTYLYFTNKMYYNMLKNNNIFDFENYKKKILIYIDDLYYLKSAICCALPNIYPNGSKVNLAINRIINDNKYIQYKNLISLITVLKLGRAIILSTSNYNTYEFTSIESWINNNYKLYIDNLVLLKNNVKNNIYLLILQNKIKTF